MPSSFKKILDREGYVIVKGFPFGATDSDTHKRFTDLCESIGPMTGHGASEAKIWRVSPRGELDHVPTFSETADEAPLHTDNSWVERPEKYFALLTMRPASDGGASIVIPVAELLDRLEQTAAGSKAVRTLGQHVFPFAMPDVFVHENAATPVVLAPVIESGKNLRYRYDVIQAGFRARPELASAERVEAVEVMNECLSVLLSEAKPVKMERGDVLLANNHTVLHARTSFQDQERLLLRARMAGECSFV